ncbi:ring finger [Trichoderma cornu-damae]|uniref:Ring finger n=1 Tax=Trichoderma cornu-damae TaxID=654480 RepID=A0A9P8TU80_9HYPO|nr:ring finger [Trichoderma cornu-damae]
MNPSNPSAGKSLQIQPSYPAPAQAAQAPPGFETSRRANPAAGGSLPQPTPRKGQSSRRQHRIQRRPNMGERRLVDEYDAMAELRALRNPTSRRGQTSITHLLNYSAPLHHQDHGHHHHHHHHHGSNPRSYRRNPTWGPGSGYHAVDKSRYVHANYRFIVSPEGDYSKNAADADLFLDWSNVLQVIASSESQATSCPICLSEPVAPRMARCGHIFCFTCLLRFMNSILNEDEAKAGKSARWRKCPICEDGIHLPDVRPVRFYAGQESPLPRVGDDVVLRLMARNADSTLALPRESGAEVLSSSGDGVPWHFAANVLDYARVMKGTGEYMAGQFDEEIEAMLRQAVEDEALFGQDDEWTQRAVKAVNAAKEKAAGMGGASAVPPPGSTKQSSEADFYFYSALPHLYLSPLDIRILKTKYGSFAAFPSALLPRVEHISTGHVVDDALRKRAKYLGHLPYGCVVSFLECDWTDIVPAETLESFASDIERRRNRNRDKAAQEERERLQSERLEAAALRSLTGSRRPHSPPVEHGSPPFMDMSEFQPLTAQSGASPPDPRPGFSTLASMSTSPSAQRTVWGTPAISTTPGMEEVPEPTDVDDGWLKDEDLFLSPSELARQMEALNTIDRDENGQSSSAENGQSSSAARGGGGGGGGKKKKKKQKITLMSTGGRRGI